MIQRVQTLYLAISIALLAAVTFGTNIVSFLSEGYYHDFSSYGIVIRDASTNQLMQFSSLPFYLFPILLILLGFMTIMSYKNINRQLRLARLNFFLYFILLIATLIFCMAGDSFLGLKNASREMGLGFILLTVGFPFTFLANIGIKRDKKLLDSLNRLR